MPRKSRRKPSKGLERRSELADLGVVSVDPDTDAIGSLTFTPDGKTLASGSNDGKVKLWDVITGGERTTLRPKSGPKANRIHSVLFLPDGKTLVMGFMDGTVRLWDVTTATARPRGK